MDVFLNLLVFLATAVSFIFCFRDRDGIWSWKRGIRSLRFFTILSNLFCACASLAVALSSLQGTIPYGIWLLKYVATSSVAVTFLTVMFFLGPTQGYKEQLKGWGLFLHLICPVLAIFSFCFLERAYPLSFAVSLLGMLPVGLYGALYLYKVVLVPEESRWEDFYGFNRNGNWQLSFAAMAGGAVLAGVLLCILTRVFD